MFLKAVPDLYCHGNLLDLSPLAALHLSATDPLHPTIHPPSTLTLEQGRGVCKLLHLVQQLTPNGEVGISVFTHESHPCQHQHS